MILKNGKRLDGCSDTLPIGTIQPFLGLTPPNGYLACLGQLISKAEYPELYMICGDLFGQSTETHFYLPDLRGKTIVGYDENDTLLNVMGKILGSKTHSHTSAAHTHSIDGHTHTSAAHTHSVAGHTHTSAAHTHTTGNHTLTVAEIPAHSHAVYGGASVQSSGGSEGLESFGSRYSSFRAIEQGTYNTGGGGAHNHGNTGSTTPGNTGSTSLTTNSTTPGDTGSTSLTTKSTTPNNTGESDNFQPSIAMNWIVKAVMLVPNYFVVENTLTSTNTGNALSAAQGKILNEKIDARATYSLEEKIIGSWINGKPLYRLVIQYVANPDNNYYAVMNNAAASAIIMKIENMARLDTFIENGTVIAPLPSNGDYDCRVYIQRSYGGLGVIATANSVENFREKQITAILEYTKTTD
jgi:microcystin-dependent protein